MSVQWVYLCIKHSSSFMHIFLLVEHVIGASDVTASFELQANPEGQEGSRTQGARRKSWVPEPQASLVRERQAPEHSKPPFTFESLLNMLYLLLH